MTNHQTLHTHKAYTSLVCDIVYALSDREWAREAEVISNLANIPSDVPDLSIQFVVTKMGSIGMNACSDSKVLATWFIDKDVTGIEDKPTAIMQLGRLQAALETFWDSLQSKCMRVDLKHRQNKEVTLGVMSSRGFFADRLIRLWLGDRPGMIFNISPGEVKIGTDRYHLNRSWRRNVRRLLAQDV